MSRAPQTKIYSTTDPERIERWCNEGLQQRVHFRDQGGLMEEWYHCPEHVESMAIATVNNQVIGVAMIIDYYDEGYVEEEVEYFGDVNIGVYVKYNYRRCGIGKALIRRIRKRTDFNIQAGKHNRAASALYKSTRL